MLLKKGIIVSLQMYSIDTTIELAQEIINAGAVAIRTDKIIDIDIPLILLKKVKIDDSKKNTHPYITPNIIEIRNIEESMPENSYIAVDYRRINNNLAEISNYCKKKNLNIVADIRDYEDYKNIIKNNYYYTYIATTFSVLDEKFKFTPNIELAKKIYDAGCSNVIGEGNYYKYEHIKKAYEYGIKNICIGNAITNIYKLTRKYTSIRIGGK